MSASNGLALRRSSRVPITVPIRVTGLEPDAHFSEMGETLVVNAHGCALRFPMRLDEGSALRLYNRGGRQAVAYVVVCQPMDSNGQSWRVGAKFDRPQNFWGLESCPDDWQVLEMPPAPQGRQKPMNEAVILRQPQLPSKASQAFIEKIEEQLSEERLRGILGRLLRPLQTDVAELQEKVTRNARQNRFEVSLGHIQIGRASCRERV